MTTVNIKPTCGIKFEDLSQNRLAHMVRIYDNLTGARELESWLPNWGFDTTTTHLQEFSRCEWRFGYPGNAHAKLVFKLDRATGVVTVFIDPNDDFNGQYSPSSLELIVKYNNELDAYLQAEQVAVELPDGS